MRSSTRNSTYWLTLLICFSAVLLGSCVDQPDYHSGCKVTAQETAICMTSDMAKVARRGRIQYEHSQFNITDRSAKLLAARNETIGFQLIVRNGMKQSQTLRLSLGDIEKVVTGDGANSQTLATERPIQQPMQQWYAAHYHVVDDAGYYWGPRSEVLRWPNRYPDALVPQTHTCGVSNRSLFNEVKTGGQNTNQAIWIDTWFPPALEPGTYRQTMTVSLDEGDYAFEFEYDVLAVTLPEKPTLNAVGELYRTYRLEGAGEDRQDPAWKTQAHCYQQLAHQHRMVFIERTPNELDDNALANYIDTYRPVLDGTLFSDRYGYSGTGQNTPPAIWRTPWPQTFNGVQDESLTINDFSRYQQAAQRWANVVEQEAWFDTEYYAYIFDEVEGGEGDSGSYQSRFDYLANLHRQMGQMQNSLDAGSPSVPIDMIWTSHSDPSQWEDDAQLDLSDRIRLWSPNAHAANTEFLRDRIQKGDKAWFYHSGHPSVGVHVINASGIEMRTWGVITARYGFQGHFMWAINLGDDDQPFADPTYRPDDDRFGNGVMVYPGNQLPKIGYASSPGPIPSMRLKAWRRGLQDAELFYLARSIDPLGAQALIEEIVPSALSEGTDKASWSSSVADWVSFRHRLLDLANQ